ATTGPSTIRPMPTDNQRLITWVMYTPTNHLIAEACEQYGLITPAVLLVMATRRGPEALATKAHAIGIAPPPAKGKGRGLPIVEAWADMLTGFATQHPEQLLARNGTGQLYTAVDENGERYEVWANLEDSLIRG